MEKRISVGQLRVLGKDSNNLHLKKLLSAEVGSISPPSPPPKRYWIRVNINRRGCIINLSKPFRHTGSDFVKYVGTLIFQCGFSESHQPIALLRSPSQMSLPISIGRSTASLWRATQNGSIKKVYIFNYMVKIVVKYVFRLLVKHLILIISRRKI